MDGGCTHGAEKAHGTAPGTAADSSRAKLQTGGRECRIKTLPYKVISGRIKMNCNMRFGCCHKTVDGLALRCGFSAPCEGRFLNMKNPSIRHGERDDTMSDFEILSLVIMTAGLIVQILIYIKKK